MSEGTPINHEGEAGQFPAPLQDSSVSFPLPQVFSVVERAGFTPALAGKLRSLNDTLSAICPAEVTGFNLVLTPDALTPKIDFEQEVDNPFKVELTGIADGRAALRISVGQSVLGDNVLFSDIKGFVKESFPDKKATFHTAPTIEFNGPVYIRGYSYPTSLFGEERMQGWSQKVEEAREGAAHRFLDGVLPTIDEDLENVTDQQIERLTERVEGADVTITFYSRFRSNAKNRKVSRKEKMWVATQPQLYQFYEIKLEGQQESFLKFDVINAYKGRTMCVFSELFYRGQPEEIEQIMGGFSTLLQNTPAYKRAMRNKE